MWSLVETFLKKSLLYLSIFSYSPHLQIKKKTRTNLHKFPSFGINHNSATDYESYGFDVVSWGVPDHNSSFRCHLVRIKILKYSGLKTAIVQT